jgi:pimeloyl-ACP methyl ester carboxylesterase
VRNTQFTEVVAVLILGVVLAASAGAIAASLAVRCIVQWRTRRRLTLEVPPGIAEGQFVRLGGVEQWVHLRGEGRKNPVLLVVHGGPGASYTVLTPDLRPWERDFVVVQWDRRGVGKTLGRNGKAGCGEVTYSRMANDAIELCEWLRRKLEHRRIVLLSSSAGTPVALIAVQRRPDLFSAWVATDMNVSMGRAAERSQAEALAWAAKHQPTALRLLERMGADPTRWTGPDFNRRMRVLEGLAPHPQRLSSIFVPRLLRSPEHGLRDVVSFIAGLNYSVEQLLPELARFDAWSLGTRCDVPFFVFQGEKDVFTSPDLARAYFDDVQAPQKRFELLPGAGHMGAFVEADRFLESLRRHVLPIV